MASSHHCSSSSVKLNKDKIKEILKKDIHLHTKSVPLDLQSNFQQGIGVSRTEKSACLDKLMSRETREVLNRAAKRTSGYQGEVDNETMDMIIDILVNRTASLLKQVGDLESKDDFSCTYCWELMYNPVTLPCGHTFCKSCLSKFSHCKECKNRIDEQTLPSTNIVSTSILQKLHPVEYIGRSVNAEADALMKKMQFEAAILKYMDAMEYVSHSTSSLINRAKAFASLGNLDCAVQDVTSVITFSKNPPEVHLIKGEILLSAEKDDDALVSFLSCIAVDPSNRMAITHVKEILEKLLLKDSSSLAKKSRFSDSFERDKIQIEETETSSSKMQDKVSVGTGKELVKCTNRTESLLSTLLREIEWSVLSDKNFAKYLAEEGKEKIVRLLPREHNKSLIESSDLECSLCMLLYLNPVCTPCGHSFCRECLERCLDHGTECPLCKRAVSLNVAKYKLYSPSIDTFLQAIIKLILPKEYSERLRQRENEVENLLSSTPVFVCTLAFPTIPCPLHIFEPRYRLLVRRALDIHDKEFGICSPAQDKPFHEIGTIVKIKTVSFFPDGRSVVESVGSRRFQVLSYGKTDGYDTAKIQYLVDKPVQKEEDRTILAKLAILVYNGAREWFQTVECKERITKHFGDFPIKDEDSGDNGPKWLWWLLAVLPVEDKVKSTILSKTLLRERLLIIHRILTCLKKKMDRKLNHS